MPVPSSHTTSGQPDPQALAGQLVVFSGKLSSLGRKDACSVYVFRTRNAEAARQAAEEVKKYQGARGFQGYTDPVKGFIRGCIDRTN